jgi:hypothetical protein
MEGWTTKILLSTVGLQESAHKWGHVCLPWAAEFPTATKSTTDASYYWLFLLSRINGDAPALMKSSAFWMVREQVVFNS